MGSSEPTASTHASGSHRRSASTRRLAAIGSLLCWAAVVGVLIAFLLDHFGFLAVGLLSAALFVTGVWWFVIERDHRHWIGLGAAIVGTYGIGHSLFVTAESTTRFFLKLATLVVLLAGYYGLGRLAVHRPGVTLSARPAAPSTPAHAVMIGNPWSGGGKVDRFDLLDLAADLGVETVMLREGLDLEELARDAVRRGAGVIGMAGGDGSQALVASIAVEADIPYVCIPAGTRNHLALDLGLDREDPRAAMAAFTDQGVERRVDYGTVDGRFFVNNVSLGVYAELVQQDSYRDAKVETTLEKLPEMLGSRAEPFDLQFTLPDGTAVDGAYVIQISNNPYDDSSLLRLGDRPRMDTGELGVIALWDDPDVGITRLVAAMGAGQLERTGAFAAFTATEFEVRSRRERIPAGVDGEALELETPLDVRIHPGGLRLHVPRASLATAHERSGGGVTLRRLWSVARG